MNVLQHTRNELNLCLKQNRPDRSYRDTLLIKLKRLTAAGAGLFLRANEEISRTCEGKKERMRVPSRVPLARPLKTITGACNAR